MGLVQSRVRLTMVIEARRVSITCAARSSLSRSKSRPTRTEGSNQVATPDVPDRDLSALTFGKDVSQESRQDNRRLALRPPWLRMETAPPNLPGRVHLRRPSRRGRESLGSEPPPRAVGPRAPSRYCVTSASSPHKRVFPICEASPAPAVSHRSTRPRRSALRQSAPVCERPPVR